MPLQKQFDVDAALDKAMMAFWDHGYEATSMQDLVQCMGVNRGSMYATFDDKHTLFLAALRRYDDKMRQRLLRDVEVQFGPREAIRQVFETFAEPAFRGQPYRGCFMTNSALEMAPHDREVRDIVVEAQVQMERFFVRMIEAGKSRGEISSGVDADVTG
ncbi:MAG: TetR/AcrR family transcriptional regulator, partial [Alphaproteobacteria bacterium]